MFERFTQAARATVAEAMAQAKELGSSQIRPEHFLLAMLGPQGFLTGLGYSYPEARALVEARGGADERDDAEALAAIGIDLDAVRDAVAANLGPDAWTSAAASRGRRLFGRRSHLPLDPAARKALELSLREAIALDQRSLEVEHLVLGLTRDPTPLVRAVLETRLSVDAVRHAARESLRATA